MNESTAQAIALIIYFVAMIMIGLWAYQRTDDLDDYMLAGRNLPPAVAALSAGASDMSGWLLMGLPGAIYATGLVEFWIAVGLTIGAYLNWVFVAPRLRTYTEVSSNSITVPSFLDNRLRDTTHLLRIVSGIIIFIFFTFYVSSGMVAGGKFFDSSFGMEYHLGMVLVAGIVVLYTLIGGFLAVSWTDLVQACMMVTALVMIPIVAIIEFDGGAGDLFRTAHAANPAIYSVLAGTTALAVISNLAWGLGYFGQPHIIVRFMALRTAHDAKAGRRIGIGWMIFSVVGTALVAVVGLGYFSGAGRELADPETVFIAMGKVLFHPVISGFLLAAVLAAIMSTISSQLLVTSSALVEDIYKVFSKSGRTLTEKRMVLYGRVAVLVVAVLAALLAWNPDSTILDLVGFAWAGFGASFGPIILLALYWRRLTNYGALAGMIVGSLTVGIWGRFLSGGPGSIFDLYEILPGFLFALLVAVLVSKATYTHDDGIQAEFDEAVRLSKVGKQDDAHAV
ncbi:MAG: sodium/proline symporter PutP [Bowdeniella nasicola]|nr:sodium/proline symporter PutP [Bowdeniella nasicola]